MKTRIYSSSSSLSSLPFFLLCSVFVWAALTSRSDSALSKDLLGISPQDETYYKALWSSSSGTVKCKDGSKKFSRAQLNDDFCDCSDGTDEPGTSACPIGKFYCRNAGHVPLSIYSSRVNDGICDCCDGSDEYDGKVKCSNTCWEAGKVARDKLKKKIAAYREGVILRKKAVEEAKVVAAKDEAELSNLKNEEKILKGLVQELKEHKEQIEKAEEKERLQKEKEEREKKEAEDAKREKNEAVGETVSPEKPVEDAPHDKIGLVEDPPLDQYAGEHPNDPVDEVVSNNENEELSKNSVQEDVLRKEGESPVPYESDSGSLSKESDVSEDATSLSKEELGRLVASRWTGEDTGKQAAEADSVNGDNHENSDDSPKDSHDEQYEGYDSETDDDKQKYEDDEDEENPMEDTGEENYGDSSSSYQSVTDDDDVDLSDLDIQMSSDLSWLEKIKRSLRSILQAVNLFQPHVNLSEAARVRKEYDESSAKLSKIQSRISSLTRKLEQDFGPEKEFFSLYKKCFEMKQNKYVYKICPFKQATQEEGYSTTRLGNWDKFEDSYSVMSFTSGDKCWNGPDRSLKAKLRCGLDNAVTDVDEPSRCEYVALLATPALCSDEKLKELEEKLELMNKEQPQGRDEL